MVTQLVSGSIRIQPSQSGARAYVLTTKQTSTLMESLRRQEGLRRAGKEALVWDLGKKMAKGR